MIATGARPRPLDFPGQDHVRTSTDFLALDAMPGSVVFIGAGYVAFEFAHVARRAGAMVTILGRGAPLQQFDQDVVRALVEHTRRLGIDVRTDANVNGVEQQGGAYVVRARGAEGDVAVEADLVIHGSRYQ